MLQFWKQECGAIFIGAASSFFLSMSAVNMYGASLAPAEKLVVLVASVAFMAWMLADIRRRFH